MNKSVLVPLLSRLALVLIAPCILPQTACSQQTSEQKQARYFELIKQGTARENEGKNADALSCLIEAKGILPDEPGIHYRIARVAAKLNRADVGKEAIATLFKLEPKAKNDPDVLAWQATLEKPATNSPTSSPPSSAASKLDGPARMELNTLKGMAKEAGEAAGLFCIWETRVKDYSAFATANPDVDGSWRNVKFKEVAVSAGPTHPVVKVGWEDARAFCAWLTKKEQEDGNFGFRVVLVGGFSP